MISTLITRTSTKFGFLKQVLPISGVSLSSNCTNYRTAIILGTLSGVGVGLSVYLLGLLLSSHEQSQGRLSEVLNKLIESRRRNRRLLLSFAVGAGTAIQVGSWFCFGWKGPAIVCAGLLPCIIIAFYFTTSRK
jgi:hypothetical protein